MASSYENMQRLVVSSFERALPPESLVRLDGPHTKIADIAKQLTVVKRLLVQVQGRIAILDEKPLSPDGDGFALRRELEELQTSLSETIAAAQKQMALLTVKEKMGSLMRGLASTARPLPRS